MERRRTTNTGAAIRVATGRDYEDWYGLLDEWGAPGRPYREVADWLTGEQGLSSWWAQKLIVHYQQARGLRAPGIRPDGTFSVSATKTVAVSVETLFRSFVDATERERWLPGAVMHERAATPGRSARFDWDDGTTRISATFEPKGEARSQIAVEHQRLRSAEEAEKAKAFWRQRLRELKTFLEGDLNGRSQGHEQ